MDQVRSLWKQRICRPQPSRGGSSQGHKAGPLTVSLLRSRGASPKRREVTHTTLKRSVSQEERGRKTQKQATPRARRGVERTMSPPCCAGTLCGRSTRELAGTAVLLTWSGSSVRILSSRVACPRLLMQLVLVAGLLVYVLPWSPAGTGSRSLVLWSVTVRTPFASFVFVHGSCPPSLFGSVPGGLFYPPLPPPPPLPLLPHPCLDSGSLDAVTRLFFFGTVCARQ